MLLPMLHANAEEDFIRYKDLTGEYTRYADSIYYLRDNDVITGTSKYTFSPGDTITRGQFICALGKVYESAYNQGTHPPQEVLFTDVAESEYYAPYAEWAYLNGIVSGYSDGTFRADEPVNLETAAVMICAYLKRWNLSVPKYWKPQDLSENTELSEWARPAAEELSATDFFREVYEFSSLDFAEEAEQLSEKDFFQVYA